MAPFPYVYTDNQKTKTEVPDRLSVETLRKRRTERGGAAEESATAVVRATRANIQESCAGK